MTAGSGPPRRYAEMAAYDSLPPQLRRYLAESRYSFSAQEAAQFLANGGSAGDFIRRLRDTEAEVARARAAARYE